MRKRARLARDDADAGEGSGIPSGSAPSQPGSGLPETGNGLEAMDDRRDVVILDGADSSKGSDMEVAAGSEVVSVAKKPVKRMSAATRRSRRDGARPLTYDKGGGCVSR